MSEVFLIILIVVAVVGIVLALTRLASPFSAFRDLGRVGTWFHHSDMDAAEAQPDPHQNDPPIQHRRIRGRD